MCGLLKFLIPSTLHRLSGYSCRLFIAMMVALGLTHEDPGIRRCDGGRKVDCYEVGKALGGERIPVAVCCWTLRCLKASFRSKLCARP